MNALRLAWLGDTRRKALCALIGTEVAEWSRDWWIRHADTELDMHLVDHHGFVTKDHAPHVFQADSGSLAFFMGGRGSEGLGFHLADVANGEDPGWARRIGEDAMADLAARILRRAGVNDRPRPQQHQASDALARSELGSCILAIGIGQFGFNLALDRVMADRLAPSGGTVARTALTTRHSALANVPARVDAMMDFGAVSLTQLADLRIGEILVGDLGLEEPLKVCIAGRDTVARAYLRRVGEKRAVVLDGFNSQEEYES